MASYNQNTSPPTLIVSMVYNNPEPEIAIPNATTPSTNPNYDSTFQPENKLIYVPSSNVIVDDERNYYSSPPFSVSNSTSYSNSATAATGSSTSHNTVPADSTSSVSAVFIPTGGHYRNINGRTIFVKQKNAHLPDEVIAFKQKRKRRTAASAWIGGVVGLFTLGPLGAIGGALGGYAVAKGVGKTREHRLTRKFAENATTATHSSSNTPTEQQVH
jgi:hypothetical protein